jgi:D-arabinose 1-dehydrogenase-like Zn-dependent alcohol dehydrogenase
MPVPRIGRSSARWPRSADKVNEAWERVLASDVRYRFVIDTATLG